MPVDEEQVHDLLFQAYETELGGVQVYEAALACARNGDLRGEWEHYLDQTRHHVELVEESLRAFGLDPEQETPGRQVVRHTGEALVKTIALAQGVGTAEQAQVVAAECVTLAETKDHLNWELIGEVVKRLDRRRCQGAAGRPQGSRRTRGQAPLPQQWLGPRAVDRRTWPARGAPASRRAERGQDGHRRRPGQAGPPRHDVTHHRS